MMKAMLITLIFAAIEYVGGVWTGSLALMSDSGHMLLDAVALGIATLAAWLAKKPSTKRHSYGWLRVEIFAALVNSLTMVVIVVLIAIEALHRIKHPEAVNGILVIVIAAIGLAVNLFVANGLHKERRSLNVRAALIHVIGDLVGSLFALAAGIIIYFTGKVVIDPILSLVIAALILVVTVNLLREVVHVLMEGVPFHVRLEHIGQTLLEIPGIIAVHELHVWSICSEQIALSAHLEIEDLSTWSQILETAQLRLKEQFKIDHVTLQPELIGGLQQPYVTKIPIYPTSHDH